MGWRWEESGREEGGWDEGGMDVGGRWEGGRWESGVRSWEGSGTNNMKLQLNTYSTVLMH